MKKFLLFPVVLLSFLSITAQDNYLTQTIKGIVADEQSGHALK